MDLPVGTPAAIVDLRTAEGAALVQARWRYSDVKVIETDHHAAGPDLRASGPPNRTNDISPHAEAADFDDSAWETIEPAALEARRSNGRLAFNWYRTRITLPRTLGGFDVTGATVVFELVVDDYAEIWVDGQLPLVLGQTGGQLIKGFNAPNRVVLTRDARPGQQFQLAIFGVNGPISRPPENFIWVRSATLDFYRPGQVGAPTATPAKVVRLDPALDRIVPRGDRDREARGRVPVRRGARLASRRLPAVQRPQRQHDLSLDAGRRGLGLPHAQRLQPVSTSASTTSPAPTGSPWTGKACSRSTSTATGG